MYEGFAWTGTVERCSGLLELFPFCGRSFFFDAAGEEFNLNSPPQLRAILYDKLGLSPGKKTPKGQLSTDASVLEKLRDAHPIVDHLLAWRELDTEQTGLSHQRIKPGQRGFPHKHAQAEEVYVVLAGSGRVKLDDEVIELKAE